MTWLLQAGMLVLYVFLSTFGLYQIKRVDTIWQPMFFVGFGCYGAGFVLWLYMLRQMPLSVIFPLAAGSLVIGTQVVGHFFLDERLGTMQVIGVAMLLCAIVLIFTTHQTS